MIRTLYGFPEIFGILRTALIDIEVKLVQDTLVNFIYDICVKLDSDQDLKEKPSLFFFKFFLDECLGYSLKAAKLEKTKQFFELMNKVLMNTEVHLELPKLNP